MNLCRNALLVALSSVVLADDVRAYWFAGLLTVIAAVVVMVVMLATSESKEDETP